MCSKRSLSFISSLLRSMKCTFVLQPYGNNLALLIIIIRIFYHKNYLKIIELVKTLGRKFKIKCESLIQG